MSDAADTASPVLDVRDLSVAFRSRAGLLTTVVHNVSFTVGAGTTLALVGESGSGKSTTAAALNGLLPSAGRITGGDIVFDGQSMVGLGERELRRLRGARIGFVPQDPMSNLNPLMRIGDQITEALSAHGRPVTLDGIDAAVALLEMVGIPDAPRRARQYPHEFSGGMRQRALIAIGLACRPPLLIADEPTSALDVTVQRRILDQLASLARDFGTAVVLITHDLALAAERADHVAVMSAGRIVELGSAEQIVEAPEHPYTRDLMAAVPSFRSRALVIEREAPPDVSGEPLVVVTRLRKEFPVRSSRGSAEQFVAVDDVSFTVRRGETVAIVGESGSGKSTTANLILGLDDATDGNIEFDGVDIATLRTRDRFAWRRRIQPVFQNPYASLDPRYTVERSIGEPLRVHGIGTARSRSQRAAELLERVALPAAMGDRLPHELSGGQRQRVAIARAIALSPDLVVLDEAVSALDVIVQAQILELLADLQSELGLSYLFISHDLAVVKMMSHTVHVMKSGSIVESGSPAQLFHDPVDPYTRELVAAIPGRRS